MNIWIPDGMKDITVDRLAPRQRLLAALDEVISEKLDPAHHIDAVESKLFGIGAESYTVGSNEFYMGYATSRQTALCLDAGHFHPTEVISDKISAAMLYVPGCYCVSRRFAGTAITWCCWMMKPRQLPVRLFVTICSTVCISVSISLMPLSTVLPRGSLVHAI